MTEKFCEKKILYVAYQLAAFILALFMDFVVSGIIYCSDLPLESKNYLVVPVFAALALTLLLLYLEFDPS